MTNCDNYCDTQFDRCQSDASDRQIGHLVSVRKSIGREINQLAMTPGELKKRIKDKDHFLTTVLKQPKLFLMGDDSVLKALAK